MKTKEFLRNVWWTIKFGFKVSPFFYSSMFVTKALSEVLPIATSFFSSLLLGEIINIISSGSKEITSQLIVFLSLVFAFTIIEQINGLIDQYVWMRMNYTVDLKIWPIYLKRLADLDIGYHENPEFKTKLKKIDDAIGWRLMSTWQSIATIFATFLGTVSVAYIFFQINILFLFAVLVPVFLNYFINTKFGRNLWSIWDTDGEERKNAGHAVNGLQEKEVLQEAKIYGFGSYIADKFYKSQKKFIDTSVQKTDTKYLFLSLNTIFSGLVISLIQFVLILQTVAGKINIQGYSFYLLNIFDISRRFERFERNISGIFEHGLYVAEFKDFLELPDLVEKPANPNIVPNIAPKIEFKNVSFKYPNSENYIIKNLSFVIMPGQKISLVGENGAGKSTIIKLLAHFYDVTEGEILINDMSIKDIDMISYYKLWGVLFQRFAKYWFSLRENIEIGNIEDIGNTEMVMNASNKADLTDVLKKLPSGLDNMLSTDFKDGKDLSGGEWQKVGIARGMFANPKFIVMDEPTSALDAIAEARVFEQIHEIAKDTTMLIVSHRFATVRNADLIIVLDEGKVLEQGTHDQLMANNALYAQMFNTQAEGYK